MSNPAHGSGKRRRKGNRKDACQECGGEYRLVRGAKVCNVCGRYWRVGGGSQGSPAPKAGDQASPLTTGTSDQENDQSGGGVADP